MQWESAWGASEGTSSPSLNPTLTAGRGLVIAVIGRENTAWNEPTVTGTGNTVSVALATVTHASAYFKAALYYISSITTGGAQTVAATVTSGIVSMYVRECSDQDTTDMLDVSGSATGSSASAALSLTTTVADDIIVVFGGGDFSTGDPSDYGILTSIAVQNNYSYMFGGDTDAAGAAGSKTATFTISSGAWVMAGAAFKSAGAAAAAPKRSLLLGIG